MAQTNMANAFVTQLTQEMSAEALQAEVNTTTGAPQSPCILVIEPDSDDRREYVLFDGSFTGTTFVTTTISNRYLEDSAAGSGIVHPIGSVVTQVYTRQHFEELHERVDDAEASISGKADSPHGNAAHSTNFAAEGHNHDAAYAADDHEHNEISHTAHAVDYTLALTDAGTVIELNSSTAITLTVPPNSSVAFPIGSVVEVYQLGAGQVTIAAGTGVTINTPESLRIAQQHGVAVLRKRDTDIWSLEGRLEVA